MAVGDVRYFGRATADGAHKYRGPGWEEWGRELILSMPGDPVFLFEREGELPLSDTEAVKPIENVGVKHDGNKIKFSLIPKGVLRDVVGVLTDGGRRYGDDNWQRVPNARQRYFDAASRHLDAWWGGEPVDPDSGRSHLAHVIANAMFLLWMDKNEHKEK